MTIPNDNPAQEPPTTPDPLNGKRALILGLARQGQALANWLPSVGAQVTISDKKNFGELADAVLEMTLSGANVKFALGGHPLELLDETDVVFVSGGVPLTLPILEQAEARGVPISNDAQTFLERVSAPVIGITGSAGKTTTTTLIGKMCEAAGKDRGIRTWVGGNIGHVLLDELNAIKPEDQVVMELSSFQLELVKRSPQVAVVLNITPNHLDRHGTMEAYMAAKAHLFLHQNEDDLAIFGKDDPAAVVMADTAPARVAWFSMREIVADGAFLAGSRLMITGDCSPDGSPHTICNRDEILLRGDHNVANVLAACAAAGAIGVPVEVMRDVIRNFRGVPHRLEIVRVVNGVTYINDSIATAPERVQAAIRSFTEPLVLLAGGRDKKLPWADLASMIAMRVRYLVTFGEYGTAIAEFVKAARFFGGRIETIDTCETLDEAVRRASQAARSGEVVLLSPGCTSYDAYNDFEERGEKFRELVNAIGDRGEGGRGNPSRYPKNRA